MRCRFERVFVFGEKPLKVAGGQDFRLFSLPTTLVVHQCSCPTEVVVVICSGIGLFLI